MAKRPAVQVGSGRRWRDGAGAGRRGRVSASTRALHGDACRYRGGPAHDRRRRCCARRCCRRRRCRRSPAPRSSSNTRICRSPIRSRSAAPASSSPRSRADERRRGVIAMSAGNHAQAVAYHARRLGIPATIVMPVTTPFVKVKATEALRRRRRARRRDGGRGAGARRSDRRRAQSRLGAPLRRSAHHRRAGHHRARNAGGRAGSRRAGRPDRRRRPDRRLRHRRARRKAVDRDRRRRRRALSVDVERAASGQPAVRRRHARRRHRGQECRQADAAGRARTASATSSWSTRR